MKLTAIRVGKRHRQHVGDVRSLAASIAKRFPFSVCLQSACGLSTPFTSAAFRAAERAQSGTCSVT